MKLGLGVDWLPKTRRGALTAASVMVLGIACVDDLVWPIVSLRLLYILPILIAAGSLDDFDLVAISLLCAFLAELRPPFGSALELTLRLIMAMLAYWVAAVLMREMSRQRKTAAQTAAQQEATEQQLLGLVGGMPAAVLSISPEGKVLLANEAAHELLGREPQLLLGDSIDKYLPVLAQLRSTSGVRRLVRTMLESMAFRHDGQTFLAHVWVSSYGPPAATGLSVVLFDASEQLRTHEEAGLHSLTTSARVIMGAFWHETRNLCSAMRVLVSGLMQRSGRAEAEELSGLQSLIESLEKLAYFEQHPTSEHETETASVRVVIEHLRVVIEPSFKEKQITLNWRIADNLPLAYADQHGLLQVFLNVTKNASRALDNSKEKELTITTRLEDEKIKIAFHNSGPQIEDPEKLFKPFQSATIGGGLGLYVSRAILRSFGGELKWEPSHDGCCFVIELQISPFWYTYGVGAR